MSSILVVVRLNIRIISVETQRDDDKQKLKKTNSEKLP